MSRGAEAYSQAYEYIRGNNPNTSPRICRRMAWQYLMVTAALDKQDRKAARGERRRIGRENEQRTI
jgi:hypothetical protein